jgi:WhiB family redox-sensing transcriptional regulator
MAHEELDLWRKHARCFGMDPNLFVPSERGDPGGRLAKAKKICNGTDETNPCPVRRECGDFADQNELVGLFGGVMHSQRRRRLTVMVEIQDARPRRSA